MITGHSHDIQSFLQNHLYKALTQNAAHGFRDGSNQGFSKVAATEPRITLHLGPLFSEKSCLYDAFLMDNFYLLATIFVHKDLQWNLVTKHTDGS